MSTKMIKPGICFLLSGEKHIVLKDSNYVSALNMLQQYQDKTIHIYLDQCKTRFWSKIFSSDKLLKFPDDLQGLDYTHEVLNKRLLQKVIDKMDTERKSVIAVNHPRCCSFRCEKVKQMI